MKKNLGKKRFELSDDCQTRIAKAFHDFETVTWKDDGASSGRKRALKAKVLDNTHFFYRKVTIERPQRMRFDVTEERLQGLVNDSGHQKLKDAGVLLATLNQAFGKTGKASWLNAEEFRLALQAADDQNSLDAKLKPSKLKAKQFEVARKFFGIRDKTADITTNEKGEVIPDADLRDAEYIPFSVLGNDIEAGIAAYFDREVKPHWSDAWVNETVRDLADGYVGVVGCEMNFNREFYVYEAPRSRDAIRHDIEVMEKRFMEMLKGIAA